MNMKITTGLCDVTGFIACQACELKAKILVAANKVEVSAYFSAVYAIVPWPASCFSSTVLSHIIMFKTFVIGTHWL